MVPVFHWQGSQSLLCGNSLGINNRGVNHGEHTHRVSESAEQFEKRQHFEESVALRGLGSRVVKPANTAASVAEVEAFFEQLLQQTVQPTTKMVAQRFFRLATLEACLPSAVRVDFGRCAIVRLFLAVSAAFLMFFRAACFCRAVAIARLPLIAK